MAIQMLHQKSLKKLFYFQDGKAAKLYDKELTKLIQDLSMQNCSKKLKIFQKILMNLIEFI